MNEPQGILPPNPATRVALPQASRPPRWVRWLRWGAILLFVAAGFDVGYLLAQVLFSVFAVRSIDPSIGFAVQSLFYLGEGCLAAGLFLAFLALNQRWPSDRGHFAAAALVTLIGGAGSAILGGYLYYSLFFHGFTGFREVQAIGYLGVVFGSLVPVGLGIGVLGFLRIRLFPRPA